MSVVTVEPMDTTVRRNNVAIFSVTTTSMTSMEEHTDSEVTYQWQRDGKNLTEIPDKLEGVNSANLTILAVTKCDEGQYRCIIGDNDGNYLGTSTEATLTVGKAFL